MNVIDFSYLAALCICTVSMLVDTLTGRVKSTSMMVYDKQQPFIEKVVFYKMVLVLYGVSSVLPVVNVIMAVLHLKYRVDTLVVKRKTPL